jgi:hypothetical protein
MGHMNFDLSWICLSTILYDLHVSSIFLSWTIIWQFFKGFVVLYIHWTRVWYALQIVI